MACDAHCHVGSVTDGTPAPHAGLRGIVICSTCADDYDAVQNYELNAASSACTVYIGFGVHPLWTTLVHFLDRQDQIVAELESRLSACPNSHCGEIGIDESPRGLLASPLPTQITAFEAQLHLAAALWRAVSVHCVRAHGTLLSSLQRARELQALPPAVLLHSWGGNITQTNELVALLGSRALFSFQGDIVTPVVDRWNFLKSLEPQAHPGRKKPNCMRALELLPYDALCFETDAPDQAFDTPATFEAWCSRVFNLPMGSAASGVEGGPPRHTSSRVYLVIAAAAIWRTIRMSKDERVKLLEVFCDEEAARAEFDALVAASTANVQRVFGSVHARESSA